MALPQIRSASTPTTVAVPVTTYDARGLAEDIHDIISLISPADTPCYSMFRQTPAEGVVVTWQMDKLRAPKINAAIEAGAAPTNNQAVTGILQNWTQIFDENANVSSTVAASRTIGRANEMDYQVMKRGKEIKRDIEHAIVGINQAVATGDTSTARKMASLSTMIDGTLTTGNRFGNTANGAAAAGYNSSIAIIRTGAGSSPRALIEPIVLAAHQKCYNDGADPNWLLVNAVDAGKVANFAYVDPTGTAAAGVRIRETGEGTLYNKVETYISPYGTLSVVTDRFVSGGQATIEAGDAVAAGDGYAFLVNTDQCFIANLQPFQSVPLAKVGHYEREMVFTELTLGVENNLSCAVIGDLTII